MACAICCRERRSVRDGLGLSRLSHQIQLRRSIVDLLWPSVYSSSWSSWRPWIVSGDGWEVHVRSGSWSHLHSEGRLHWSGGRWRHQHSGCDPSSQRKSTLKWRGGRASRIDWRWNRSANEEDERSGSPQRSWLSEDVCGECEQLDQSNDGQPSNSSQEPTTEHQSIFAWNIMEVERNSDQYVNTVS